MRDFERRLIGNDPDIDRIIWEIVRLRRKPSASLSRNMASRSSGPCISTTGCSLPPSSTPTFSASRSIILRRRQSMTKGARMRSTLVAIFELNVSEGRCYFFAQFFAFLARPLIPLGGKASLKGTPFLQKLRFEFDASRGSIPRSNPRLALLAGQQRDLRPLTHLSGQGLPCRDGSSPRLPPAAVIQIRADTAPPGGPSSPLPLMQPLFQNGGGFVFVEFNDLLQTLLRRTPWTIGQIFDQISVHRHGPIWKPLPFPFARLRRSGRLSSAANSEAVSASLPGIARIALVAGRKPNQIKSNVTMRIVAAFTTVPD